jgi:hypothetical protein
MPRESQLHEHLTKLYKDTQWGDNASIVIPSIRIVINPPYDAGIQYLWSVGSCQSTESGNNRALDRVKKMVAKLWEKSEWQLCIRLTCLHVHKNQGFIVNHPKLCKPLDKYEFSMVIVIGWFNVRSPLCVEWWDHWPIMIFLTILTSSTRKARMILRSKWIRYLSFKQWWHRDPP